MSKCAVEFGSENKIWIHFLHESAPALCDFGLDVSVERRVDLDGIEVLCIKLQVRLLQLGRIELSIPIFVLPSGGADVGVGHLVLSTLGKRYLSGFDLRGVDARRQLKIRG